MTADATSDLLEMSEEDWQRLATEAKMTDPADLMRLIRLFSSVYNDMRTAADKRVLLEVAAIKATHPAMESDISGLAARVLDLEQKLKNGAFTVQAPSAPAGGKPETKPAEEEKAPERVLSKADWETLNEIRNRWKQVVRRLPRQAAWPLEEAWIEPKDGGVMSIVFKDRFKYNAAVRFETVPLLEAAMAKDYGKAVSFDVRAAGNRETQPRFVTDEDLAAIPMDIETED
jgi:DNA polymerase-3 subunit gamma/tau